VEVRCDANVAAHEHSRNGLYGGTDMDHSLLMSLDNGGLSPEVPDLAGIGPGRCCPALPAFGQGLAKSGQDTLLRGAQFGLSVLASSVAAAAGCAVSSGWLPSGTPPFVVGRHQ